jgi:hypothetical protein
MKLAACQLAFFTFMIFADVGSAIYAYYFTYDDHLVCIQIVLALKNCNLFAQFLITLLNCKDDLT